MKLSPLHLHLSMPTQKFEEKKDSFEIVFLHTKVVFSSPKSATKGPENDNFGLFLRPSVIALYEKSSLYFKSIDFLPKNDRYVRFRTFEFIESLSIKKLASIKLAKILT